MPANLEAIATLFLFPCFSGDQDLAVRNLWSLRFCGPFPRMFGDCRFAAASCVPFLSFVLPALPALAPPSTRILDPNWDELLLPLHWRPPCWKRGGEFGQIDDNRWSAIRQGGVPQSRNSLTWGFAGAFFSLRPACRKTARFAPCDHRLSCVCPNSGAFSQQPPRESPVASSQRQPPPPRIPSAVRAFACRGWLRAIARRVFRLGPLS